MDLIHYGDNYSRLDPRTYDAIFEGPLGHGTVTQAWLWEGGDAAVGVVGTLPDVSTWVILRLGERVHTVEASGLRAALRSHGIDSTDWTIVTSHQAELGVRKVVTPKRWPHAVRRIASPGKLARY